MSRRFWRIQITRLERAAHDDAEFNGMALVLFALQFEHNAGLSKILRGSEKFSRPVTHWAQIPACRLGIQGIGADLPAARRSARVFHSSGTTEQRPSRHFHSTRIAGGL